MKAVRSSLLFACDAILNSYAIIFFARSRWLGAALLAATFIAPQFGAMGLCGLLLSLLAALALGFDRAQIRGGALLFNSLLVSLAIAFLHNYQPLRPLTLVCVLAGSAVITVFMTVFLANVLRNLFGLPAMSLPFVAVTYLLFFLFFSFTGTPITAESPYYLLPEPPLAWMPLRCFLQAFGAIFFLPHATVGLVVLIALLFHSRLAVLFAAIGFAAGITVLRALNMDVTPAGMAYIGFNFVFSAIALGGVFFIASKSSVLLVLLGTFFCAVIAIAVRTFWRYFGVPPLALPFNMVVLLTLYALRLRTVVHHLFCTPFAPDKPEVNVRGFRVDQKRFPDVFCTCLLPPFFGVRAVTQGFNGAITHRGDWRHGLDFELLDEQGARFENAGDTLADFHTYDTPVVAPAPGTVVRVVDGVRDNEVGTANLEDNWGNVIVLQLDNGAHAALAHLKRGSIEVRESERVAAGRILARVGNSGRSPMPHLHLQVQASPRIGSPTVPFRLCHYVDVQGKRLCYHATGVPAEGSRIRAVPIDSAVAVAFESFVAKPPAFRVTANGKCCTETLEAAVGLTGLHELRSCMHPATLTLRLTDRAAYAVAFTGDRRSVLLLLYLGLSRLPYTSEANVHWSDDVDPRPLLNIGGMLWQDLAGPFVGMPTLPVEAQTCAPTDTTPSGHTLVEIGATLRPTLPATLLRAAIPTQLRIALSKRDGISSVHAVMHRGTIDAEAIRA